MIKLVTRDRCDRQARNLQYGTDVIQQAKFEEMRHACEKGVNDIDGTKRAKMMKKARWLA
jgi:hypothetical protein